MGENPGRFDCVYCSRPSKQFTAEYLYIKIGGRGWGEPRLAFSAEWLKTPAPTSHRVQSKRAEGSDSGERERSGLAVFNSVHQTSRGVSFRRGPVLLA
jgi:hypothetical protein